MFSQVHVSLVVRLCALCAVDCVLRNQYLLLSPQENKRNYVYKLSQDCQLNCPSHNIFRIKSFRNGSPE